jgi:hypothetical protein
MLTINHNRYPPSRKRSQPRRDGTLSTRSSFTPVRPKSCLAILAWVLTSIGKILKDEETVGSYNIEEKGFVVCMVNKVRFPLAFM